MALWSERDGNVEAIVERVTAMVVLALGSLVVIATVFSVTRNPRETLLGNAFVLLLVVVAMWRAVGHLQAPSRAR